MSRKLWVKVLQQERAIAVIRAQNWEQGCQMAKAVAAGGMKLIEITWNSDRPEKTISYLRSELPDCQIGCGTLLNLEQLEKAIASGAEFLFTPHVDLTLIQTAIKANIPIVPGALSPTEIVTAWQAGASCVKVFPIQAVGGASYIRSLQGPLGNIPLIPTGGVTLKNALEFLQAGAIAVGLAGDLFPQNLINKADWQAISTNAKNLMQQINLINMKLNPRS
ncbi:bifunctional 4-hydroxy-2-oxoglutarate aldolase/2-dehydro-3-deoxy-phosphogluconate aldolase [Aerosakkonemataceae cyanobacterium BLCC-F50]|uniref:Bifunctional 4-hydroxy-2-oxoglutarate aldolase/2-dehydro-3-deoxy-phosphogluconate aldolase n=1 Tax=Floridaenema flaviceps BLCC-F50 TaxID=3153642 RepID=A0ABV4XMW9_9CYAN